MQILGPTDLSVAVGARATLTCVAINIGDKPLRWRHSGRGITQYPSNELYPELAPRYRLERRARLADNNRTDAMNSGGGGDDDNNAEAMARVEHKLVIDPVHLEDDGEFKCSALSSTGKVRLTVVQRPARLQLTARMQVSMLAGWLAGHKRRQLSL